MIPSFEEVWKVTEFISDQAMHPVEVQKLYDLCMEVPTGGLVVEVGCQLGRSSSVIAQVGKAVGFHSVHIDPYTEQPEYLVGWVRLMHSLGSQFTLLCMRTDQAKWHLGHLCELSGLDEYDETPLIDLAFIDGDHEQAGVEIDLNLVANKIRPGGILLAHDYATTAHPGVALAVDKYVAHGWEHLGNALTMGVWRRL